MCFCFVYKFVFFSSTYVFSFHLHMCFFFIYICVFLSSTYVLLFHLYIKVLETPPENDLPRNTTAFSCTPEISGEVFSGRSFWGNVPFWGSRSFSCYLVFPGCMSFSCYLVFPGYKSHEYAGRRNVFLFHKTTH